MTATKRYCELLREDMARCPMKIHMRWVCPHALFCDVKQSYRKDRRKSHERDKLNPLPGHRYVDLEHEHKKV